jgi:very-short-patch-repair endonuclease
LVLVEVDGESYHTESPAAAEKRLEFLKLEGAYVRRIPTNECDTPEKARTRASELAALIEKQKSQR